MPNTADVNLLRFFFCWVNSQRQGFSLVLSEVCLSCSSFLGVQHGSTVALPFPLLSWVCTTTSAAPLPVRANKDGPEESRCFSQFCWCQAQKSCDQSVWYMPAQGCKSFQIWRPVPIMFPGIKHYATKGPFLAGSWWVHSMEISCNYSSFFCRMNCRFGTDSSKSQEF